MVAAFFQFSWAMASSPACIGSTASAKRPKARKPKAASFRTNA